MSQDKNIEHWNRYKWYHIWYLHRHSASVPHSYILASIRHFYFSAKFRHVSVQFCFFFLSVRHSFSVAILLFWQSTIATFWIVNNPLFDILSLSSYPINSLLFLRLYFILIYIGHQWSVKRWKQKGNKWSQRYIIKRRYFSKSIDARR